MFESPGTSRLVIVIVRNWRHHTAKMTCFESMTTVLPMTPRANSSVEISAMPGA
jgi:hypothetical protein